jgi:hypothetical protein
MYDKYLFISLENLRKNLTSFYPLKACIFSDTSLNSDVEILSMYLTSGAIDSTEFMSTIEYSNEENLLDDFVVISSSASTVILQSDQR